MVDFTASFTEGIEAAKQVERNRQEIDSVFEDLNRQLDKASEGKISIQVEEVYLERSQIPVQAITARHKIYEEVKPRFLARWYPSSTGYPCKINIEGDEIYCENREGLEQVLGSLLSRREIGQILYGLMKREPSSIPF